MQTVQLLLREMLMTSTTTEIYAPGLESFEAANEQEIVAAAALSPSALKKLPCRTLNPLFNGNSVGTIENREQTERCFNLE